MPGTFTTNLVRVQAAEATADYVAVGGLKAALAANDDYKVEGTFCLTFGPSSTSGTGTYHLGAKDLGISAATVSAGGTGYTVGDRLTVVGGTGIAGVLVVATLSGTAVATVTVSALDAGSYTVVPVNPVSVAGGTGSGATFNLTTGGLNLTGQGLHVFAWIKDIAWPSLATKTAGGMAVIISSDTAPTAVQSLLSATVSAGGTGYTLNDVLTVSGGVGTAAQVTATGVSGGVVTTVVPVATARGSYTTFPTSPAATTGGTGTGATLTLTSIQAITNTAQWFVGGSNINSYEGWVPYVVDIDGTADLVTGTASLTSVDLIGLRNTATSVMKLLSGITDINWYGTGSTMVDGTGSAPITMADYQAFDNANSRAWGIVTLQEGIYFIGGKLNIGTTTQTAETVLKDKGITMVYHDFPVASGFYEIKVVGASGQKTTLQLGDFTPSSGLTSNGCTIKGAGNLTGTSRLDGVQGVAHSRWTLTASDANQVTKLYGCTLTEMLSAALAYNAVSIDVASCTTTISTATLTTTGNFDTSGIVVGMKVTGTGIPADTYVSAIASTTSLTMNKNATASGTITATFTHNNEIRGCSFSNFGTITTNGCVIDNCTFQDLKTGAPISATWALIVNSTTEMNGRITNSKFINCNRAIKITAIGTYTFDKLTFSANSFDIENSSAGLVTINATNGANPVTVTNTGGGSTVINNAKTITVTVKDSNNVAVQSAQVWIQKDPADTDFGHEAKPFTSAAGNNAGDADFVVSEALPSDIPSSGLINVTSSNRLQSYRYASKSGSTFTLRTGVTGTDNGSGTTTTINETGISAKDIVEGDTIRMTASPKEWANVLSNTGDVVTTTATSGGTSWSGKAYGVHTLVMTYQQTTDKATVPLMNEETNASGVATESYNFGSSKNVIIRVRKASSGTKYLPYSTTGTITGDFTLTATLTTDTIA